MKRIKGSVWDEAKGYWIIPAKGQEKPRPRSMVRRKSKRRARADIIYRQERLWFLADPANEFCPVAWAGLIPGPNNRATTQIHHMKGRAGSLYLDKRFWLAVSHEGHAFIHANPKLALERGWMIYH